MAATSRCGFGLEQDTERRCHAGSDESLTEQWADKRRELCRVEADSRWFDFGLSICGLIKSE